MQTVYLGNTLINDFYLGSQKVDDIIGGLITISDSNAFQFLQASGLTGNQTISSAINQLCVDLKSSNLFNKFYALYPFVGNNASSSKYNLINTGSYTLGLSGSWSYGNGITGNGTNTYANTALIPSTISNFATGSSLMVYVTTNSAGGYDIGSETDTPTARTYLISRYSNSTANTNFTNTSISTSSLDSTGMWISEVSGSSQRLEIYKNTSSLVTPINSTSANLSAAPLYIGANNFKNTSISDYSSKTYAMAGIGKYFTSTEVTTLYTIVQSFETSMSRQV